MVKNTIKVGIIGQGFVGSAIASKILSTSPNIPLITYDKFAVEKSTNYITGVQSDLNDLVINSDIIFICVPTPMYEDGECDIRIVESVISDISKIELGKTLIIKSTIPPGTTKRLNVTHPQNINFSPEFLTEANAIQDFHNQTRIIIGTLLGEENESINELFRTLFPKAEILTTKSCTAEMVKYTTNLFLATKVSFFNDIHTITEHLDINYNDVVNMTLLDNRIGKSHTRVPGPDGDKGFGGHCFPKDISALLFVAYNNGLIVPTIAGAKETNDHVRKDKDWEKMENRAVSKR